MQMVIDLTGFVCVDENKHVHFSYETGESISVREYFNLSQEKREGYFLDLGVAFLESDHSDIENEIQFQEQ